MQKKHPKNDTNDHTQKDYMFNVFLSILARLELHFLSVLLPLVSILAPVRDLCDWNRDPYLGSGASFSESGARLVA